VQSQYGMSRLFPDLMRDRVVLVDRKGQAIVTELAVFVDSLISAEGDNGYEVEMKERHPIPTV
jgi:hypothetical protein